MKLVHPTITKTYLKLLQSNFCSTQKNITPVSYTHLVNEIKDEIGGMAMEIAGKVIEREISEEDHAKLIDDFIANVGETS